MSKARQTVETLRTVLVDGDVTNANFTGADLEVGKGGTGASSAGAARTALGLAIGTDVLAPDGDGSGLTGVDSLPSQTSQTGKFLTTNGSAASWGEAGGGGLSNIAVFTSSGTWTRPSGITKLHIRLSAGGGSGGASRATNNTAGCGGSGGGYTEAYLDVSAITSLTIVVGAKGAAQYTAGATGNNGGNSTVHITSGSVLQMSATGGVGGLGGVNGESANGDNGGTSFSIGSTVLIMNIQGGFGGPVVGAANSTGLISGAGGVSFLGNAGTGSTGNGTQIVTKGYGGGGTGGNCLNAAATQASAQGQNGICIIEEYK